MTDDPAKLLRNLARQFYRRGWMEGTAGNLSMRREKTLFITASGRPKGRLSLEEILSVPLDAGSFPSGETGLRPSAEISIHQVLYRLFPGAGAVLHVHTVESSLVSESCQDSVSLPPLEVLKGLEVTDPGSRPDLPVFENDLHVPLIATKIEKRLKDIPRPLPGLLIRHHGTTVWGETLESAVRHLELFEFCFRYMIAREGSRNTEKP
jgi:methylthioribulose-1-phosphate dehydratase